MFSKKHSPLIHILLFIITIATTLVSGTEWITGKSGPHDFLNLAVALPYSFSVLFIIGVHEFGHYFAARYHKVDVTLPYFIPFPPLAGFLNFGTMGAVIRTRSIIVSNKAMFDIGIAGPIAGFFAAIVVLIFGYSNLPEPQYILSIHPDYFSAGYGQDVISLKFGSSILFEIFNSVFNTPTNFIPPMTEIYHYPYLTAGWLGLFITAMNMIPVGQLDGGHVLYSMFGTKKHEAIASISMILLIILGVVGALDSFLQLEFDFGWTGWLVWALVLNFVIKVKHPPVFNFQPLDSKRMMLGYFSLFILIITFTPSPFVISF
ncbi:MAG: site-2 protease family protein [Melioribacteraceae bacterium]|jgi:membrane-associated protease RseP (regulator of RpoE activity)|nr:site-2 protease family protein [Melioribacteraceae bacterium]